MNRSPSNQDLYAEQLTRWAQALSGGETQVVEAHLARGCRPALVKMFTDGNLDKRLDKLLDQLEFVAGQVDDFEALAVQFIRQGPLWAYDTGASDGERMLRWLEANHPLDDEQRDYVACQRARHAVEERARENRLRHIRFQDWSSVASRLVGELGTNERLLIHLNPVLVWTTFTTPVLLGQGVAVDLPAEVAFFACSNEIRTAVLQDEGRSLLRELHLLTPCTLHEWAILTRHADRRELVQLGRDLAELGLAAFS